jgi:hypothetical protein
MSDELISWNEAVARVGRARFGQEWVGNLTHRERYLIDEYGDQSQPSSIHPGVIRFVNSKRLHLSPSLAEELAQAEDRKRWKVKQDLFAFDWLQRYGLRRDHHRDPVNRTVLDAMIEQHIAGRSQPKPVELAAAQEIQRREKKTLDEMRKDAVAALNRHKDLDLKRQGYLSRQKDHVTAAMDDLTREFPRNHLTREEVNEIAGLQEYRDHRRSPGNPHGRPHRRPSSNPRP